MPVAGDDVLVTPEIGGGAGSAAGLSDAAAVTVGLGEGLGVWVGLGDAVGV